VCRIDEFVPASAENTKSVGAIAVPQNVPARVGTHSPFKDGRIAFEQIEVHCQADRRQAAKSRAKGLTPTQKVHGKTEAC
jgi:hypothetical protein